MRLWFCKEPEPSVKAEGFFLPFFSEFSNEKVESMILERKRALEDLEIVKTANGWAQTHAACFKIGQ